MTITAIGFIVALLAVFAGMLVADMWMNPMMVLAVSAYALSMFCLWSLSSQIDDCLDELDKLNENLNELLLKKSNEQD